MEPTKEEKEKMEVTRALIVFCGKYPTDYKHVGNVLYEFLGKPAGAELTLLCTYVHVKLKERGV